MTLGIVLFAKNDSIIIASDKCVTGGTLSMSTRGDFVEKVHKVNNKCGLTVAGDPGSALVIIDLFLKKIAKRAQESLSVSEAAEIFRKVAVTEYTKWFKEMSMQEWVDNVKNEIIPHFRVLLSGFDTDDKGQAKRKIVELSSIRRFAPTVISTNFAAIGVTSITQYLLYRFYSENQDEDAVAGLAALCIQETNSQDSSVGSEFQIATFSNDQAFQFYSDEDLRKIKQRCAELKTELQTTMFSIKVKEQ